MFKLSFKDPRTEVLVRVVDMQRRDRFCHQYQGLPGIKGHELAASRRHKSPYCTKNVMATKKKHKSRKTGLGLL